jgi:hypothetical protein
VGTLRRVRDAVPRPVRRLVYQALPVRLRNAVVRRVRPPSAPGEMQLAQIDDAGSPLAARSQNLDRVVDALDAAGVPYFRVPALRFERTTVAVPASSRDRAERVLAELIAAGAHSRPILPGPRVTVVGADVGAALPEEPPPPVDPEPEPVATAVWWPVTDPGRRLLFGVQHACEIEYWQEQDDRLIGPRYNRSVEIIDAAEPEVQAGESVFGDFHSGASGRTYRTREPFLRPGLDRIDFPIDVVYTWVDGGDPAWLARKNATLVENGWATGNEQAANASRFISRNELRYSLRSLHYYAPWVRRIFLVTDDQVPEWLNVEHPQVTVVSHKEIFGAAGKLPTFNSMAIETRLHHIEGLAEHFLYVNDDVFFGQPLQPGFFFTASGQTRFFPSPYRVDAGDPVPGEAPVMSAGKNNRRIIEREFGRYVPHKVKHTPHAARRSVLAEIEAKYPEPVAATSSHQFRHPDDIAMLSSLQQHWSFLTGRAVFGNLEFTYRDLADPRTPKRLGRILRRRPVQLFCLNDTDSSGVSAEEQAKVLNDFLPKYYPFPSPYELPEPAGDAPAAP